MELTVGERYQVTLGGFPERQFADQFGSRGVTLRGIGVLNRALKIKTASESLHDISQLQVCVMPNKHVDAENGLRILDEGGDQLMVALYCHVDDDLFGELCNPALTLVTISFELKDQLPLDMSGEFARFKVADVWTVINERRNVEPLARNWVAKTADITPYAMRVHSQLGRIAVELTAGLHQGATGNGDDDDGEQATRLDALFSSLRCAVPSRRPELVGEIADIRERVKGLPPPEGNKLAEAYDTVWATKPSRDRIASSSLDPADSGELAVFEVESAAENYLASGLTSFTLERLVVDALLFAETAAFARELLRIFPQSETTHASTVKLVALEAGWLIGTAFVAFVADSHAGAAFWVVFCAITAVRWLRQKPNSTAADPERSRLFGLLNDMAVTQGRMVSNRHNPRLVRERLYDLERRGAVFSQYVYSMLDRWIERDTASGT